MDRQAVGVHHRVNFARQAPSRATHILVIIFVEYKVRDRPGHAALKRGLSGSALVSGPVVSRGCSVKAMKRNGPA